MDATLISACLAIDSIFYGLADMPDGIHKQTGALAYNIRLMKMNIWVATRMIKELRVIIPFLNVPAGYGS